MSALKQVNRNDLQRLGLACPNCKAALSYKGTTEKGDLVLYECKSGHCPIKAVILVTEQVSDALKPLMRA